jgi:dihydroorotase
MAGIDARMDVVVAEGRVVEVAPHKQARTRADQKLDAGDLIVAPGFIDLHVHLREPGQSYKETIASGTAAAAAGGFTSVCCMPNTAPVVDSVEWVDWLQKSERGAVVNVFPIAAATIQSGGEQLTDFRALKEAGAVAVTDDGKPILDAAVMTKASEYSAELDLPVIQHAEDTRMTEHCSMNDGPTAFRLGLRGMPAAAEGSIVERDLQIARSTKGRLHVAHLSTAQALRLVRGAKSSKIRVTCEVTPHHFTMTDESIGEYDTNCKMNPPLRSAEDVKAIVAGVADGTVDAIATDHAPHALHEKRMEFERAPFGIIGLETALGLAITQLHIGHNVPLKRIVELLTAGPAQVLNLKGRGTLAVGSPADVTVFDPGKRWTFDVKSSLSKSRNTPFHGWKLTGKIMATIVAGRVCYRAE